MTKAGLGGVFGVIYLANFIFPVNFASRTLGICNILARFVTFVAPIIAEMNPPIPMIVVIATSISATIIQTQLMIKPKPDIKG